MKQDEAYTIKQKLNLLGPQRFEELVQALASAIAGEKVTIYGKGPDGQREFTLETNGLRFGDGVASKGYTVGQAKFRDPDNESQDRVEWVKTNLHKELKGFRKKQQAGKKIPDTWIFFTNVTLTPGEIKGDRDTIEKYLTDHGYRELIPHIHIRAADDILSLLNAYPGVKAEFFGEEANRRAELIAHLADIMKSTRKDHPSFKLMQPDELDPRLFPRIEALGSVGEGGISPVWELIVRSWQECSNRSIVLIGEGGIGKTVALLSPDGDEAQSVPALYDPLFELVEQEKVVPIEEYLKKRLEDYYPQFNALAGQHWEKKPSLLLLLDGVNELPAKHRRQVVMNWKVWADNHDGVQLVAVSRPLDKITLDLGKALGDDTIYLKLARISRETAKDYLNDLGREIPEENAPIWEVLELPLFLVLYAKTGKLDGKTACGYPLAPKAAVNGGALIWNYLQRELLRKGDEQAGDEQWVLECAVACEYLLPAVGYEMVKNHRFTIQKADLDRLLAATMSGLSEPLPKHLRAIFDQYDDLYGTSPAFDGVSWRVLLIHELGLLTRFKGERNSFTFLHQHFRDAFAGLHLVNAAEAETVAPKQPRAWNAAEPKASLPELWQRSQPPLAMEYAAELMEEETAKKLWDALRVLWPADQKQQPANRAALYMQLELHRLRDDLAGLDFSGMDLRGISLIRYEKGLFRTAALTKRTKLDAAVFQGVGHSGPVTCVAVLEDDWIISGSRDRTLCIWDTNNGMCLKVLSGHTDEVTCIAVLNDGRIVSGGFDNTIREWDKTTGKNSILLEQIGLVACLAEASENIIVIGRKAREFLVWNPVTGQSSFLDGIPYWSTCVTVLDDGRLITGSYGDHSIKIWGKDWEKGSRSFNTFFGHQNWVYCVTAIGNNQVASGSQDNIIQVWNTNTRENKPLIGHNGPVTCIVKHGEDGIISGSRDDTILHWNIKTETSRTIYKHSDDVNCIALLDDERIVSGFDDGTLLVIDVYKGTCLQRLGRKRPHILNCSISPNGDWATAHSDGTIRLWSRKNICCTRVWMEPTNRITCIAYLKNEKIVGGLSDNTIRVWDFSNDCSEIIGKHSRTVRCIVQLRNEKIASGSDDKTIKIIDLENNICEVLPPFNDGINSITEVDDERLVVGLRNNSLWVCNIQTGFRRHLNEIRPSSFSTVVLLKNGQIASGSNKGKIKIWDTDRGELYETSDSTKAIFSLLELGNGRLLSASRDSMIRVWDLDSGESKELKGHTKAVTCIIRLDDSHVVSGSYDCTFRVWDVNSGKCLAVIPVSEMDVTGMDLTQADYPPELAELLYYNGAAISPTDEQRLKKQLNP